MVSRGEVWWADAPGAKRRPYLVVTRDVVIPHLSSVIAIPTSRRVFGIPSEVILDEDDGMPTTCALNADLVTQLAHDRFVERICTLSRSRMREVYRALQHATACR